MILGALGISACARSEAFDNGAASDEGPSKVQPIKGTDLSRIILTAQAAQRLGIRTAQVREIHGHKVIPYAAVLYDAHGGAFAYTSPARLTFIRRPIRLARIAGATARLKAGPPVGTTVVTVGAPELFGTEYGVEE